MKTQFSILSAILILFAKLAAAQVYPPEPGDFKVTAPFDFVVGKQALPPGNYVVHWEKASNKLQICEDGVLCETVKTVAINAPKIPVQPKMIFDRYGKQTFSPADLVPGWHWNRVICLSFGIGNGQDRSNA